MSRLSTTAAFGAAAQPGRIDLVLIAAAVLFVALLAAELLIGVRAAPSVDLLAPAYVT